MHFHACMFYACAGFIIKYLGCVLNLHALNYKVQGSTIKMLLLGVMVMYRAINGMAL